MRAIIPLGLAAGVAYLVFRTRQVGATDKAAPKDTTPTGTSTTPPGTAQFQRLVYCALPPAEYPAGCSLTQQDGTNVGTVPFGEPLRVIERSGDLILVSHAPTGATGWIRASSTARLPPAAWPQQGTEVPLGLPPLQPPPAQRAPQPGDPCALQSGCNVLPPFTIDADGTARRHTTARIASGTVPIPFGAQVDILGPPVYVDVAGGNLGGTPITHYTPVNVPGPNTLTFYPVRYVFPEGSPSRAGQGIEGWMERGNFA